MSRVFTVGVLIATIVVGRAACQPSADLAAQRLALQKEVGQLRTAAKWDDVAKALEHLLILDRKIHGPVHGDVAATYLQLALAHEKRDDLVAAVAARQEVFEQRLRLAGDRHWQTIDARIELDYTRKLLELSAEDRGHLARADALMAQVVEHEKAKRHDQARAAAMEALTIRESLLDAGSSRIATAHSWLATVAFRVADHAAVQEHQSQAWKIRHEVLGPDHPDTAFSLIELGTLSSRTGRYHEAVARYRAGLASRRNALGDKHERVQDACRQIASTLDKWSLERDFAVAYPVAREAVVELVAQWTRSKGRDHWETIDARLLLAHIQQVAAWPNDRRRAAKEADEWIAEAIALQRDRKAEEALVLTLKACERREQLLGPDDRRTLSARYWRARLTLAVGRDSEANEQFASLLESQRRVLGDSHPRIATTLHWWAAVFNRQTKRAEAEGMLRRALAMRKATLGIDHADYAESVAALASAAFPLSVRMEAAEELARYHERKGNWDQAAISHRQVWEARSRGEGNQAKAALLAWESLVKALSEADTQFFRKEQWPQWISGRRELSALHEHRYGSADWRTINRRVVLDYAIAFAALSEADRRRLLEADAWIAQTRALSDTKHYAEALALATKADAVRRDLLGPRSSLTLTSQGWIGYCLWLLPKRSAEALEVNQEWARAQREVLGAEHPAVAVALFRVGSLLLKERSAAKAEEMFLEALRIRRHAFGKNTSTLACLDELASLYRAQEHWVKTEEMYREALEMRRQLVGEKNAKVAQDLANLGFALYRQDKNEQAIPFHEQALALRRQVLGEKHYDVSISLLDLYFSFRKLRRWDQAEAACLEALRIRRHSQGKSSATLFCLDELASLYRARELWAKTEEMYREALEMRRQLLGEKNAKVAQDLANLGHALYQQDKNEQAIPFHEQALALRRQVLGEKHYDVTITLMDLYVSYRDLRLWNQAEAACRQALALRRVIRGEKHERTASCLAQLAYLYRLQGVHDKSEALYQETLAIRRTTLGETHTDTIGTLSAIAFQHLSLRNYAESEAHYRRVIDLRRQAVGEEHTDFAGSLIGLGNLYRFQGHYAKAEPLYLQALQARRKNLGDSHPDTIATLSDLAFHYRSQMLHTKATPLYQRVLEMRREARGEKHPQSISSLAERAHQHRLEREYAKAQVLFERVLELRREVQGEHHPLYALALKDVAYLHRLQGRYADAERFYRQALELRKKRLGPNHPDVADSLADVALVYRLQGDAKAKALYEQVAAMRLELQGETHSDYTFALVDLALGHSSQGEHAKAEELLHRALELRRKVRGPGHTDVAWRHVGLAAHFYQTGDYAKSEQHHQRALEIRSQVFGPKHEDIAESLSSLSHLAFAQGDYPTATFLSRQALEMRRDIFGDDHFLTGYTMAGVGDLLVSQKRFGEAGPLFEKAVAIFRAQTAGFQATYPCILNKVARYHQELGQYDKAEALVRENLEACRKNYGERSIYFAFNLAQLGALHYRQGKLNEAEPLFRQALEIRQKGLGQKHPLYAKSLNQLGMLLHGRHDEATACRLIAQGVEIARFCLENSASIQSERQQIAYRELLEYHLDDYLRVTRGAAALTRAIYDQVLAWKGSVTSRQRLARLARQSFADDPAARKLFEELEALSKRIATLAMKSTKDPVSPGKSSEASGSERGAEEDDVADAEPQEPRLANELAALGKRREQVEAQLSARTEAFRRLRVSQKLDTAGLQKLLPPATLVVDFVVYGDQLTAFVIGENQVDRVELGTTAPLAAAIEAFRGTMKRSSPFLGQDDVARELRKTLVEPLARHLGSAKLVLIAPEGPLNQLPFAALPGLKDGNYLIEEIALVVLPVPQMLHELLSKREAADDRPPSLLALGDVDFDVAPVTVASETTAGWKRRRAGSFQHWVRLPGTLGEILSIEDTFRKAVPEGKLTVLREGQASEATVRQQIGRHEYLHFATHGFFAPRHVKSVLETGSTNRPCTSESAPKTEGWHPGLLSGIVLAGANRPKEDDDGVLTALEVADLDLAKVELAVLSACETGLGEVAGGEGVVGLQRAFQVAGARSAVTSLWKVDDEATRKLMERFYQNYWKKGMSVSEALRDSQLWMLREGALRGVIRLDPSANDASRRTPPYYWAAFLLSGDWR